MGLLSWIIVGAFIGWLAGVIMATNRSMGVVANIIMGIAGALVGGGAAGLLGGSGITGFTLWGLLAALLGAVIFLAIAKAMARTPA